jgi:hypothetical protein
MSTEDWKTVFNVENQNTQKKLYNSQFIHKTESEMDGLRVYLALCNNRPAPTRHSHGMVLSEQLSKYYTWKKMYVIKSLNIS